MHRHYRDYMPAGHIVKDFHLNKQNAFIISKHESNLSPRPSPADDKKTKEMGADCSWPLSGQWIESWKTITKIYFLKLVLRGNKQLTEFFVDSQQLGASFAPGYCGRAIGGICLSEEQRFVRLK